MARAAPAHVDRPVEVEVPVTVMRKSGPERFDVVTGVVRGVFTVTKVLDQNGSLVVARGFARKSLAEQHRKAAAALGITVES